KHIKWTQTFCLEEDIRIAYTDAACPQDGTEFATAWAETTTSTQGRLYHATTEPITQAAHRACADIRHTTVAAQQLRLSVQRLRAVGHDLTIHWVPGYSGIPSKEKANRLSRALLLSVQARARSEDTVCLSHEEVESRALPPDPAEDIFKARHCRRAYLLATANPLLTPFPPSQIFSRRQRVTFRQIKTGTILTPYLLQRLRQHSSSHHGKGSGAATTNFLVHAHSPRTRTLATIQQSVRPTLLHAWACPDPSFPKVTAIELLAIAARVHPGPCISPCRHADSRHSALCH
ncbi:hypothetical protein HPB47_010978, partial [Ixodes persulcatus]